MGGSPKNKFKRATRDLAIVAYPAVFGTPWGDDREKDVENN
jgi:hypothetical protein